MVSREQLMKELKRLKQIKRKKEIFILRAKQKLIALKKAKLEKLKLEKEISDLRNPKSTAFKQNIRRLGRLGFKAVLLVGEDIDKRVKAKLAERRMSRVKMVKRRKR